MIILFTPATIAGMAFIRTLDGYDAEDPGTYIATELIGIYLYSSLFLNLSIYDIFLNFCKE